MIKNMFAITITLACLLYYSGGYAHERVVIVPLNSSKIIGVYSQPYQFGAEDTTSVPISNYYVSIQRNSETVPEGKRLFIQNLSIQIRSDEIVKNPICRAHVLDGPYTTSTVITYPLLMTKTTSGTSEVFTATPNIMLFAEATERIGILCTLTASSDVTYKLGMSGYYIDL